MSLSAKKVKLSPTALVIYEGPSLLDGKPIVVIATKGSSNSKTGHMIQTWIIRSDIDPISANRLGEDFSICGACPLRGIADASKPKGTATARGCYVSLVQAPTAIYNAFKRGIYRKAENMEQITRFFSYSLVRLGSYGDFAAVPSGIKDAALSKALKHTAYSHQWAEKAFNDNDYMASVETLEQAKQAWHKGFRTFRTIAKLEDMSNKETLCPASSEAVEAREQAGIYKDVTCADCGLCGGAKVKGKNIVIVDHGTGKKHLAKNRVAA